MYIYSYKRYKDYERKIIKAYVVDKGFFYSFFFNQTYRLLTSVRSDALIIKKAKKKPIIQIFIYILYIYLASRNEQNAIQG